MPKHRGRCTFSSCNEVQFVWAEHTYIYQTLSTYPTESLFLSWIYFSAVCIKMKFLDACEDSQSTELRIESDVLKSQTWRINKEIALLPLQLFLTCRRNVNHPISTGFIHFHPKGQSRLNGLSTAEVPSCSIPVRVATNHITRRISSYHSGAYEKSVESQPAFRKNVSPLSSGSNKSSKIPAWLQVTSRDGILFGLFFFPDDRDDMSIWNAIWLAADETVFHPRWEYLPCGSRYLWTSYCKNM